MKNKFTGILALAALTAVFTVGCSKKENPVAGGKTVVKAVTGGSLAPYCYVDESGKLTGIDIEITREVFARLPQYELVIETADALQGVLSGQYDFAVNNYGYTKERGESYYYSYPYKTSFYEYIQRAGDKPLESLQDLADRHYKIQLSPSTNMTIAIEEWNEQHPDHKVNIEYTSVNFQLKFQNIAEGVTDVAIDDGPILDALLPKFGLEGKLVGNVIDPVTQDFLFKQNNTYFLFAKDAKRKSIRDDVNKVLKELKKDGTLAKYAVEYFGSDTSPKAEFFDTPLN